MLFLIGTIQTWTSGKKETSEEGKKGKVVYEEFCSGKVLQVIELPAEANPAKATAMLKNGVLELQMPTIAKSGSTRIKVKAA